MTLEQTIECLDYYNRWRLGEDGLDMPSPKEVTITINAAIKLLNEYRGALKLN
jgi:hypothetical protein